MKTKFLLKVCLAWMLMTMCFVNQSHAAGLYGCPNGKLSLQVGETKSIRVAYGYNEGDKCNSHSWRWANAGIISVTTSSSYLSGTATITGLAPGTQNVYVDLYKGSDLWHTFTCEVTVTSPPGIQFADAKVKALCVANWDTNGDGGLSEAEAAAVTSLGGVFKGKTEITSFNELQYFTGLTYIHRQAFEGCSGLASITIPNGVKSIGYEAFKGCTGLASITIPNGVKIIDFETFKGCTGLTSVNIPNSVTSIGRDAFYGCSGLTSINIPNSVTSIGRYAFGYCSGLTSITIPNSVTSIEYGAFSGCIGLTSIVVESGNAVYDSRNNCNAIIETTSNILIKGCNNTVIPEGVASIGDLAFNLCSGLTSVTIPNSVTSIGYDAFAGCSGLTSVTIPEGVTRIGDYAFELCRSLTSITIPNSVTEIGEDAFENTAWYNNKRNGLVYAGKVAYKYKGTMPKGTGIVIKDGTLGITGKAFYKCSGLTSVTIPNSVTNIGRVAFYGCSGLTSISIPNSVTSIGREAFYGTAWYNNQPDGLVYAGKVAYIYKGTMPEETEIVIKGGTLGITGKAFYYCSGLTSITIPSSLTNIGDFAFYGCSGLTSVTIGSGVTSIGEYAFNNCSGLQSIICYAKETPEVSENTFDGVDVSNVTLLVPRESVQKYKDHPVWGKFKIEVITGIEDVRNGESGEDMERSIYDLSGRKLPAGRMPQGIYIRNGRKIAVKVGEKTVKVLMK